MTGQGEAGSDRYLRNARVLVARAAVAGPETEEDIDAIADLMDGSHEKMAVWRRESRWIALVHGSFRVVRAEGATFAEAVRGLRESLETPSSAG
jgi:hypothetical protein